MENKKLRSFIRKLEHVNFKLKFIKLDGINRFEFIKRRMRKSLLIKKYICETTILSKQ